MRTRRKFLQLATAAAPVAAVSRIARAQAYPARPITMVVPFPAGGPTDTIGRVVAEGMRASLGQPVVIDNVGGAAGSLATGKVARAAPDGYTIGLGSGTTHVANGAIYSLNYDVVTSFEPVSMLTIQPMVIVAKKTMQADTLQDLIAWLRANPDKASQGTAGAGSTSHLAGIFFQMANRHALSIRALSQHRYAGPDGRVDRPDDRSGGKFCAAGSCRHHKGLRGHQQAPHAGGARCPDGR